VDFGNNCSKKEIQEYIAWCGEWLSESERVLTQSGTMYIYGFSEILAHLSVNMNLDHRWLIWHYTNKTVPSAHFWQRSHESILCAWKDKNMRIFNRETIREPYTEKFIKGYKGKGRKRPPSKGRFVNDGTIRELEEQLDSYAWVSALGTPLSPAVHEQDNLRQECDRSHLVAKLREARLQKTTIYEVNARGALPRDVLKISSLAGGAGSKERIGWCHDCHKSFFGRESKQHTHHETFKHPTQKPFELTRRLLLAACPPENAKVLIPFAGSGTECHIARILGMNYLSFDLNPEYVIMANDFINKMGAENAHAEG
jgi:site-specific DNA-methyltransferase (adenine-specific)